MQVPSTQLRRKIAFWQSHGILVETSSDVFSILEDLKNKDSSIQEGLFVEDYEAESAMASAQDQREEELQVYKTSSQYHFFSRLTIFLAKPPTLELVSILSLASTSMSHQKVLLGLLLVSRIVNTVPYRHLAILF